MSSRIVQLADGGLTPALRNSSSQLNADMWEAIDKATDSGMPVGLLIGHLEFIKSAIFDQHFHKVKNQ